MTPQRRRPQDTPPTPGGPAKRRKPRDPIGAHTCPLLHHPLAIYAAKTVRGWLRVRGFWQTLTNVEQLYAEELLLHTDHDTGRCTIYMLTLATTLGIDRSTARRIERTLETLGYLRRHEWREGPSRHRRGLWWHAVFRSLLANRRTALALRDRLTEHLLDHLIANRPRLDRYLTSYRRRDPLFEALSRRGVIYGASMHRSTPSLRRRKVDGVQRSAASLRSPATNPPEGSPPVNPAHPAGSSAPLPPPVTGDSPPGPSRLEGFTLSAQGADPEDLATVETWVRFLTVYAPRAARTAADLAAQYALTHEQLLITVADPAAISRALRCAYPLAKELADWYREEFREEGNHDAGPTPHRPAAPPPPDRA